MGYVLVAMGFYNLVVTPRPIYSRSSQRKTRHNSRILQMRHNVQKTTQISHIASCQGCIVRTFEQNECPLSELLHFIRLLLYC